MTKSVGCVQGKERVRFPSDISVKVDDWDEFKANYKEAIRERKEAIMTKKCRLCGEVFAANRYKNKQFSVLHTCQKMNYAFMYVADTFFDTKEEALAAIPDKFCEGE